MKRITKSSKNRVIFGVCGGLGEYFERDPVLFRLVFIILLFMSGIVPFIIAYIIAALIIPEPAIDTENKEEVKTIKRGRGWLWFFIILLIIMLIMPLIFLVSFISYRVTNSQNPVEVIHEEIIRPNDETGKYEEEILNP